jgi:hypothetical protein
MIASRSLFSSKFINSIQHTTEGSKVLTRFDEVENDWPTLLQGKRHW